jgi:hypothetical protein
VGTSFQVRLKSLQDCGGKHALYGLCVGSEQGCYRQKPSSSKGQFAEAWTESRIMRKWWYSTFNKPRRAPEVEDLVELLPLVTLQD